MGMMAYHLNAEGRQRIEAAVTKAETLTAGEIVPVLARRSARYGHAPWVAGTLLFCAFAGSGLSLGRLVLPWGSQAWWLLDLAVSALGGWLLGKSALLRHALTPRKDREQAVHRAAELAFHRFGLQKARHDAGVLLYVSLLERHAVVLAGPGIHAKAKPGQWDDVCAMLLKGAARRDLAAGFETAIAHTAEHMAEDFPAKKGGSSPKLSDKLRILHDAL